MTFGPEIGPNWPRLAANKPVHLVSLAADRSDCNLRPLLESGGARASLKRAPSRGGRSSGGRPAAGGVCKVTGRFAGGIGPICPTQSSAAWLGGGNSKWPFCQLQIHTSRRPEGGKRPADTKSNRPSGDAPPAPNPVAGPVPTGGHIGELPLGLALAVHLGLALARRRRHRRTCCALKQDKYARRPPVELAACVAFECE